MGSLLSIPRRCCTKRVIIPPSEWPHAKNEIIFTDDKSIPLLEKKTK